MKIAVLGKKGSFHSLAASEYFGDDVELSPNESFEQLISSVKKKECQFGFIAIENSTAGSILPNYGLIRESNMKIVAEHYKRIELSLLAKKGTALEMIEQINSHPMALLQCKDFLSQLKNVQLVETKDTQCAALDVSVSGKNTIAAIANEALCAQFKLEIVQSNIESFKQNFTRFFVIHSTEINDKENNKSSLCFTLRNEIGTLADVLMQLKLDGFNLTKIQSMPKPGFPGVYLFYIDIEYPVAGEELKIKNSIASIATDVQVLGSYKKMKLTV